jgi:hypothetical protein
MVYKIVSASTSKVIDIMATKSILRKFAPGSVNFGRKRTPKQKCRFAVKYRQKIYHVSDPENQFWHTGTPKIDATTGKPVQIHDPEIVEFETRSWIDEGYDFSEVKREMHVDTFKYKIDKRHKALKDIDRRTGKFASRVIPKISSITSDFCIEYEKFCDERSLDT